MGAAFYNFNLMKQKVLGGELQKYQPIPATKVKSGEPMKKFKSYLSAPTSDLAATAKGIVGRYKRGQMGKKSNFPSSTFASTPKQNNKVDKYNPRKTSTVLNSSSPSSALTSTSKKIVGKYKSRQTGMASNSSTGFFLIEETLVFGTFSLVFSACKDT